MKKRRFFEDWSAWDLVHAYGEAIIPGGTYEIQAYRLPCEGSVEDNFSTPLEVKTSRFGDLVGEPGECRTSSDGYMDCWTPPQGAVDFDDITACVDKFINLPGAPAKARADLAPNMPDLKIDFTDLLALTKGFRSVLSVHSQSRNEAEIRPGRTQSRSEAEIRLGRTQSRSEAKIRPRPTQSPIAAQSSRSLLPIQRSNHPPSSIMARALRSPRTPCAHRVRPS